MYKVETPFRLIGKTTTIQKVDRPGRPDHFVRLATIEYHTISPTKLRFGGGQVDMDTYLRPQSFRAADLLHFGRLAMDKLTTQTFVQLDLNDGAGTPVARYHRRRLGIFSKSQKAYVEIFEAGEGIVDEIMVTLVYVEKLRKDAEASEVAPS